MILRQDSECTCISVGLKSNTYCNGHLIIKEINLKRNKYDVDLNYCSWQLKIRGLYVDFVRFLKRYQ